MQKLNWKPKTALEKAGTRIVRLLNKQKYQAFFVGGVIRDYLLKKQSDNLDIATDAKPNEVEKVLNSSRIHFKQIGKKFGTILAIMNGQKIEITTFRRESRYSDQRHPDQVEFIREYLDDAQRRDLTINALYFNPVSRELFDPVNGLQDIKNKMIRFVGDPRKRIDEDSLRMIRAVRLATVLGFKVERNSFAAIKTRAKLIQNVSGERIKHELDKILLSDNRTGGIRMLEEIGLLRFILPEFSELKKVFHKSKHYHLEGDGLTHALLVADSLTIENLDLIYAALLHDVGKIKTGRPELKNKERINSYHGHNKASQDIFRKLNRYLKFSRKSSELILWLINEHDHKNEYLKSSPDKQISYALRPNFRLLLDLWQADITGNLSVPSNDWYQKPRWQAYTLGLKNWKTIQKKNILLEKLSRGELIIKETKLKPGIEIGQLSEKIKIKIVQGVIKNETDARNFLKKFRLPLRQAGKNA